MPDQTKMARLLKQIKQKEKAGKVGAVFLVLGFLFVGIGITMMIWQNSLTDVSTVAYIRSIAQIIFGVIFSVGGVYIMTRFAGQRNNLMKELEKMTIQRPNCPNCGRELSEGNFEFCPFCGKPLKT